MSKIVEDFRAKSDDELQSELGQLKKEQFNLRFQSATGQMEKPARVRVVRRSIARIKTLQTERAQKAQGQKTAAEKSA